MNGHQGFVNRRGSDRLPQLETMEAADREVEDGKVTMTLSTLIGGWRHAPLLLSAALDKGKRWWKAGLPLMEARGRVHLARAALPTPTRSSARLPSGRRRLWDAEEKKDCTFLHLICMRKN